MGVGKGSLLIKEGSWGVSWPNKGINGDNCEHWQVEGDKDVVSWEKPDRFLLIQRKRAK